MAKSKFDPNAAFKSIIGVDEQNGEQQAKVAKELNTLQAAGVKGRPKVDRETKKRVSLAVLPSLYEDIQKIAYVERKSISEIVSNCLEQYAAQNAAKLKEYNKIKRA